MAQHIRQQTRSVPAAWTLVVGRPTDTQHGAQRARPHRPSTMQASGSGAGAAARGDAAVSRHAHHDQEANPEQRGDAGGSRANNTTARGPPPAGPPPCTHAGPAANQRTTNRGGRLMTSHGHTHTPTHRQQPVHNNNITPQNITHSHSTPSQHPRADTHTATPTNMATQAPPTRITTNTETTNNTEHNSTQPHAPNQEHTPGRDNNGNTAATTRDTRVATTHARPPRETDQPPPTPTQYRATLNRIWPHPVEHLWHASPEYLQIYNKVRLTAMPNHAGARIPVPSGLNIQRWREHLIGYQDELLVEYLEFGWPVDYTASEPPTTTLTNHTSDPTQLDAVRSYVAEEMQHGAILGPFTDPPFAPWSQSSPIMTRAKKNTTARRIIVDLTWPRGSSVNSGIRKGYFQGKPATYTLPNIMDAADEVARIGRSAYLWTADLARAYRQLRACPLSTPLLGITIDGAHYTDIAPPFGCRTSSMACARTTAAVVYLLRKRGHFVHCYLDDFVGVAPTKEKALDAYRDIITLTEELGLRLAPKKCTPPSKEIEWLGFRLSVTDMSVTIPADKLDQVLDDCAAWMKKRSATRKEVQRLAGRLQHIARCVEPARRFMSRIFATLRDTPRQGQHNLPNGFKDDIRWFLGYAQSSNGIILLRTEPRKTWTIECDSSLKGGGAFSPTHYYGTAYPKSMTDNIKNIAHLEALNLIAAIKALAPPKPEEYCIVVNTDNQASQQVLSTGAGRDPTLTACAREIWLFAANNSCQIEIRHKPGKDLILADALSRRSFDRAAEAMANEECTALGISEISLTFDNALTPGL